VNRRLRKVACQACDNGMCEFIRENKGACKFEPYYELDPHVNLMAEGFIELDNIIEKLEILNKQVEKITDVANKKKVHRVKTTDKTEFNAIVNALLRDGLKVWVETENEGDGKVCYVSAEGRMDENNSINLGV
jgi:hypothetical protein